MDKQEYLNEISADTRPTKSTKMPSFLSSKFLWVGIIGLVLLVIIIVIGSVIKGTNTNFKDQLSSLILHMDTTKEVTEQYRPDVKSSDLRSYAASLVTILSDNSATLTAYATEKYSYSAKKVDKSVTEEETSYKDALLSDFFNAKITGSLDRIYAQKLTTDISLIQSLEAQLIKRTSDSYLKDILNTSYESLSILYNNFNNFSESK